MDGFELESGIFIGVNEANAAGVSIDLPELVYCPKVKTDTSVMPNLPRESCERRKSSPESGCFGGCLFVRTNGEHLNVPIEHDEENKATIEDVKIKTKLKKLTIEGMPAETIAKLLGVSLSTCNKWCVSIFGYGDKWDTVKMQRIKVRAVMKHYALREDINTIRINTGYRPVAIKAIIKRLKKYGVIV